MKSLRKRWPEAAVPLRVLANRWLVDHPEFWLAMRVDEATDKAVCKRAGRTRRRKALARAQR